MLSQVFYFSIDSLDIEQAIAAEKIEVCCFWNENLDDGILTFMFVSDNKYLNAIVDASMDTWQEKMKNSISFDKINDLVSADIVFYPEESQQKLIEMDEEINGKNFDASVYEEA